MASAALKRTGVAIHAGTTAVATSSSSSSSSTLGQIAQSKFPSFIPRTAFPLPKSIPKSYFLGHHKSGLDKMKTLLGTIDLVVECRDYRVPLTGRNELFERELLGITDTSGSNNVTPTTGKGSFTMSSPSRGVKKRVIVFTKWDLGADNPHDRQKQARDELLRQINHPTQVHFSNTAGSRGPIRTRSDKDKAESIPQQTTRALLNVFKQFARDNFSLTGHRVLVAGMPNVGKSTLLNALRAAGLPGRTRGKVAKTGAEPGVTRKVATGVKILEAKDYMPLTANTDEDAGKESEPRAAVGEGVYLLDTPGVFMPYVPSAISMLKLALVGAVRDSLIDHITLADFLLFNINLRSDPSVYTQYTNDEPTNDINVLLEGVARSTGRLKKIRKENVTPADAAAGIKTGQIEIDWEGAAAWILQRWRAGALGRFVLDDLEDMQNNEAAQGLIPGAGNANISVSQARKMERERQKEASRARRVGKS